MKIPLLKFRSLLKDHDLHIGSVGRSFELDFVKDCRVVRVRLHADGLLYYVQYYKDKDHHRECSNGPSYYEWFPDGMIRALEYEENHEKNYPGGPSSYQWNDKGNIVSVEYFVKGESKNPSGPERPNSFFWFLESDVKKVAVSFYDRRIDILWPF